MRFLGVNFGASGGALLGFGLAQQSEQAVSTGLWMLGIGLAFCFLGALFGASK